jgi:prolyl oligopeptidase
MQRFPEPGARVPGIDGVSKESDRNAMICYHRIGTPQCTSISNGCIHSLTPPLTAADIIVHRDDEHPSWLYGIEVTEDSKYLILTTVQASSHVSSAFRCHFSFSERLASTIYSGLQS